MMRPLIIVVIVVLIVLGIWFIVDQSPETNANVAVRTNTNTTITNTTTTNTRSASPVDVNGNADVVDYAIDMGEYSFSPNVIALEPGETIQVKLTNSGSFDHDFRVDELGVNSGLIQPGKSKTISVIGSKTGTFDIYCSVGSHRSLGMEGTMTVGS